MSPEHLKKAAFIDRDGVLNYLVDRGECFLLGGKPFRWTAPFTLRELRLKSNVRKALEVIGQKGYLRILVTNQPDVATGHILPDEFERMMMAFRELPLNDLYVCKHRPDDGCMCRKPAPGMLLAAQTSHGIDMARSFMIGDMETDVLAGKAAGVRTMRVTDGLEVETSADHRVRDILEAALLLP
ncbi:MAG: HAD-IIIA family hydrolase [Patescibacteria group bacterium]